MNPGPIKLSLLAFGVAFFASLALTFVVRERARRARLFDVIDERKIHTRQIPRVGGVAIFWSVALTLFAMVILAGFDGAGLSGTQLVTVLIGGAATHLLGLWDDLRQMPARYKFAIQVAIAVAVFFAGVRIDTIALPVAGQISFGPGWALLFTTFWFVGITNAFNLIDGLDGLASGAALFALTTMFVVAIINGQPGAALVTLAVAGATLGFLRYNFHPATIFLGDSGSLFLGFMLAGIGAISSQKGSTVVAIAIPVVSLGLPVVDTSLAIIRRFLRGQPIFSADRGHIHHKLLALGHSPRKVALLLYGGCAVLALGGMLLVNESGYVAVVLVLVGLGVGLVIQQLRYMEFEELARMLRRGMNRRSAIARSVKLREQLPALMNEETIGQFFARLADAFEADRVARAEVRLRPAFLGGAALPIENGRRIDDDVPIWIWSRATAHDPAWWEIKLPLFNSGERIGALTLWEDAKEDGDPLAHLHVLAGELRTVMEQRLVQLWGSTATEAEQEAWLSGAFDRILPRRLYADGGRHGDEFPQRTRQQPADRVASDSTAA
ncbi:MAG TPA: MraY family glycosyltransferase [Gemmatimonadaceae bacterium]|nr:MraY family glycosyltransferase [Gemmatimonadaceae bacterium]